MDLVIILAYCFFLTFILAYSISQFNLALVYLRVRKLRHAHVFSELNHLPRVTVQLPIYNEKYVVERLIRKVAALDYPRALLEIQVLDDSTDETTGIIESLLPELESQGVDIKHIRRPDRVGFKAGALKYGTSICSGEFIAIFDADFLPEKDFLNKTLPYFENERVGVVQSRWGHLNEDYSLLTKLQSYALNAHFTVEQKGRNANGHFINFNGTAGIWRKATIEDAGGWEGDTLTEDLDLSYRAQAGGWKFVYLQDLVSPAELPAEMNALKSQQYRWAKGAAECVRKNLGKVFRSPTISTKTKLHAFFHLMNSFVWVCVLFSGLLLLPFLQAVNSSSTYGDMLGAVGVYHFTFFALLLFYTVANYSVGFKSRAGLVTFLLSYPAFLSLSMGLSLHNAFGVIKGYLGIKSSFVRTPKFNILKRDGGFDGKSYVKLELSFTTFLEFACLLYFSYGMYYSWVHENYVAFPFLLMQAIGFAIVLIYPVIHYTRSRRQRQVYKSVQTEHLQPVAE